MPSYQPVAAALRGLEILRQVNALQPASVKALHQATGIDKATIVRMLETLIHAGYVAQHPAGYQVTGRVLQLSAGFDLHQKAAQLAGPVMARFRQAVGWPSDIAVRDGDAMIVVGTSREPGPLSFNRRPGFRAPIPQTSIGRAYLAHCPDTERAEILAQLRARAEGDPLPADAVLDRMLAGIREQGFAVMDDGYSEREYGGTLWAMAVPVMAEGRLYGALNIMMLRQAVTQDMARETYLPQLRAAAAELAAAFRDGGL